MYLDTYRTCMFETLKWLKTHPSCALWPFWSGVWSWNQTQWPNSTPTSSKFLKRSRWSFTMKTFQLYRQHWWQWPKPGPFGSKTSLVAMGAVVDGLKIIFLKTSPMWLASWWVLMGKKRNYLHTVDILQASPRQVTCFLSIKQTKHSARYTCQLPSKNFAGFEFFPSSLFRKTARRIMNPSAEVPTIKHPTNNQQLHSLKPIMPWNLKITSFPNQPKRFVGETHVLCDVTEYLDDFTWPSGQDLSQS